MKILFCKFYFEKKRLATKVEAMRIALRVENV